MFTACPECGTVFRVTTAQLRMAEGQAKCGRCSATFNALATLSDELPEPPRPEPAASGRYPAAAPPPAAPTPAPAPAADEDDDREPATEDVDAWVDDEPVAAPPAPQPDPEADGEPAHAADDAPPAESAGEAEPEPDDDDDTLQGAVEHADWEALLTEVDDDDPPAPVYVVDGEEPPASATALPADDDGNDPQSPAEFLFDADATPADEPAHVPAPPATGDDTVDVPIAVRVRADDGFGDDLDYVQNDPPPADEPDDDGAALHPTLVVIDEDDAGPVVVLADAPDRPRPGIEPAPAADADAADPLAADDPVPDPWPDIDPDAPPWDEAPAGAPAPEPRRAADFPPLWADRPAWPPEPEPRSRRAVLWTAGSAVLALALGLQVAVQQRDELATHATWGPQLRQAFEAVGLTVYPAWNLASYEVRGSEAVAGRSAPGALDVIATVAVVGKEPVGLPLVRVTLRDRWNGPLGSRVFPARDYLDRASTVREPLAPGTLVPVRIRIADPGTDAFGYEVDVCLMDRRVGLTCQAEREPFRR